ncbi:P-loop NTPase [Halorientalis regularis]|uniref:Iron-sulfur cluster carrier protein n=1 Tax=Halorientalis regularis TaxID=660518 RepID=A0A1G7R467_9EURY|nr:P-loop NTPase [Halorientalis regularis]SDG05504.1 ATP-binding protein involved in chromosome partitioning [Halorientalis regularis]
MSSEDTTTTEPLADRVEAALRNVRDPDADVTVFEAGLIDDVRIDGGDVTVQADLSEFPPSEGQAVTSTMMRAVSDVEGVERAHVEQAPRSVDIDGREVGVERADRVIAVASAKGGVGKTTVATTLACALAADGDDVALFDADIHGPNVPELLSVSGPVQSDADGHPVPVDASAVDADDGAGDLEVMSIGLMNDSQPLAWRGAMAHDALTELFEETAWAGPDTLVIDLPPGTGDVALTTLQEVRVDGVVFVTTPFHAAVSDTHRSLQLFAENEVPVLGVVSNMGEFVCDACGEHHDLFDGDDPIDALDAPVLAEVPFTGDMQSPPQPTADGVPDVALDLGTAVADRIAEIWTVEVPENAVDLRGVPPEQRRDRVRDAFEGIASGERFEVVSDRNPGPVREFLEEQVDDELATFQVKRQNPETWRCRTEKP